MAPRKPHQKTKAGCTTCKKRRIKCDEGRPTCFNCSRRKLNCSYPQAPKLGSGGHVLVFPKDAAADSATLIKTPPKSVSPPLILDVLSQSGLLTDVPDALTPMYRRLLHHFVVETSTSVTPRSQECWPRALPELTARQSFVLDGIFAMTSLHLSRLTPSLDERSVHANIANARLNKGLIGYRKSLERVTDENAEGLFSFSVATTAFVLANGGEEQKALIDSIVHDNLSSYLRRDQIGQAVAQTTRILRCLRGVMVILVPCWERVSSGIIGTMVKRDWWPLPNPYLPETLADDRKLHALERMWMVSGRTYEYYFDTLSATLLQLRHSFALAAQLTIREGPEAGKMTDWTIVVQWATQVMHEYIALIDRQVPEAWVLLAHWAMLPHRAESGQGIWWLRNIAHNFVSTAALVVGESRRTLLEWPARVVGVDLDRLWKHKVDDEMPSTPNTALSDLLSVTDSIPRVTELPPWCS